MAGRQEREGVPFLESDSFAQFGGHDQSTTISHLHLVRPIHASNVPSRYRLGGTTDSAAGESHARHAERSLRLPSPPVLGTIGDLVEDVVVHLHGPINVASDTAATVLRRRGGSAANVAVAVRRAGGAARFIGQVGDDPLGVMLVDALRAEGVDLAIRRHGRSGTIVVMVDADGERTMLSDRAACTELDGADDGWLDGLTTLHVPVYSLATEPLATTTIELVASARARSITVSVDTSSVAVIESYGVDRLVGLLADLRPDVLLCNRDEAAVIGTALSTIDAVTVVKRGPDPALVTDSGWPHDRGARAAAHDGSRYDRRRRRLRRGLPARVRRRCSGGRRRRGRAPDSCGGDQRGVTTATAVG